jgi:hypothetical protein
MNWRCPRCGTGNGPAAESCGACSRPRPDLTDLSDHGIARRGDPHTSHEAAQKVLANRLNTLVFDHLKGVFPAGLTSFEVTDRTGEALISISPRFAPLERAGLIRRNTIGVRDGKAIYETRIGEAGRPRIIWYYNGESK